MNAVNKTNDASYEFVAPNIAKDAGKKVPMVFPTAEIDQPGKFLTLRRQLTIVDFDTDIGTVVINADEANLNIGATLIMRHYNKNDDAESCKIRFGDDEIGFVVDPGTESVKMLVWNGTRLLLVGERPFKE